MLCATTQKEVFLIIQILEYTFKKHDMEADLGKSPKYIHGPAILRIKDILRQLTTEDKYCS